MPKPRSVPLPLSGPAPAIAPDVWYAGGLQFECTQCGNCCSGQPGYVWLTLDDMDRIAAFLNIPFDQFTRTSVRRIGSRYSLTETANYDCTFLTRDSRGKAGCSIYPVRPMQCRTWPFWDDNLKAPNAWDRAGALPRNARHERPQVRFIPHRKMPPTPRKPPLINDEIRMTNDEANSNDAMTKGVSDAVAAVLADAEADIAARKPVCLASGKCCKFESYGHRLYVTAAELLHFANLEPRNPKLETSSTAVSLPQFFAAPITQGCPYQIDGLCTAREARPLGCRIYFCDENAQSWQSEVYEKYHARLRGIHEQFGLPYRYLEWRAGLRELMDGGMKS